MSLAAADLTAATSRSTLPNGLELLVLPSPALPAVAIVAMVSAGTVLDPADRIGLATATAESLTVGTERYDEETLAETVDVLGSSLGYGRGYDGISGGLTVHRRDLALGIELLAETLIRPTFPTGPVERVVRGLIAERQADAVDPNTVVSETFSSLLFAGHPYGYPAVGTDDGLRAITPDEVAAFHRAHYGPDRTILVLVGDVALDEAKRLVEQAFGLWTPVGPPAEPPAPPMRSSGRRVLVIDRPELTQASVRLGHPAIARSSPIYDAVSVMNTILGGGGFASRLVADVRTKQGLAYSVGSGVAARKSGGGFLVGVQTKTASVGQAILSSLAHMSALSERGPTATELADTQSRALGSLPFQLETNRGKAGALVTSVFYDLGLDHLARQAERIAALSESDVQAAAKAILDPDGALIVLAAPAEAVRQQLEAFGSVEVVSAGLSVAK